MKVPNSLRGAQIVVGVIILVLAGMILAFPGFALFLIAVWLSVSLLFAGIEGCCYVIMNTKAFLTYYLLSERDKKGLPNDKLIVPSNRFKK
jgi:uncharacterized membrane protein HdeD (DUF308 family)